MLLFFAVHNLFACLKFSYFNHSFIEVNAVDPNKRRIFALLLHYYWYMFSIQYLTTEKSFSHYINDKVKTAKIKPLEKQKNKEEV